MIQECPKCRPSVITVTESPVDCVACGNCGSALVPAAPLPASGSSESRSSPAASSPGLSPEMRAAAEPQGWLDWLFN